jgi:hypothetical protein
MEKSKQSRHKNQVPFLGDNQSAALSAVEPEYLSFADFQAFFI